MGLTKEQKRALEFEVVSDEARLKLTRLLRSYCSEDHTDGNVWVSRANRLVNYAHQVLGLPLFALEADDWGSYQLYEADWHSGRLELIMREADTPQLVEIICDYLENDLLKPSEVDAILEDDGASFSVANHYGSFQLNIVPVDKIPEPEDDEHPNIRLLVARMQTAVENGDDALVLATSASIFETLAKIVMPHKKYQGKTLADILKDYRAQTKLPDTIIDYIDQVYISRGREPLAAHGSAKAPSITHQVAVTLCELTKAIVRIERELSPRQTEPVAPSQETGAPGPVPET